MREAPSEADSVFATDAGWLFNELWNIYSVTIITSKARRNYQRRSGYKKHKKE